MIIIDTCTLTNDINNNNNKSHRIMNIIICNNKSHTCRIMNIIICNNKSYRIVSIRP